LVIKVNGPGSGAPGATPEAANGRRATGAAKGKGVDKTGRANVQRSFAETFAPGKPAPGAAPAPARVGGTDALTEDIAADLQAGKLDPRAALERVVERVLDRQLGADAPVALRAQLRETLRDTISSDPLLADRLRGFV
jgi:hypothetical protein